LVEIDYLLRIHVVDTPQRLYGKIATRRKTQPPLR
jgi:hypothetical protein